MSEPDRLTAIRRRLQQCKKELEGEGGWAQRAVYHLSQAIEYVDAQIEEREDKE